MSASTMSGQREGVVRLTPLRSSTETSSVNPSTEAAVCTTTSGTPPMKAEATLPMSVIVPPPMLTTASLRTPPRSPARSPFPRHAAPDDRRPSTMRRTSYSAANASSIAGLISVPVAPDRGAVHHQRHRRPRRRGAAGSKSSATAAGTTDQGCDPIRTDFSPHGGSVPSGSAWSRMRLVYPHRVFLRVRGVVSLGGGHGMFGRSCGSHGATFLRLRPDSEKSGAACLRRGASYRPGR